MKNGYKLVIKYKPIKGVVLVDFRKGGKKVVDSNFLKTARDPIEKIITIFENHEN